MKKQVLVTVDRGETRVAMLEAAGEVPAARRSRRRKKGGLPTGYRVAEVYFERRGGRSIVGNIYKGKVDNVLPGLEAAFVDFGLDKNGFLHVDEIVLPGVEQVKRGRGKENGPRITDLLRPGQEIVVQVIKDPLKTKGARLTMELTIAGRYMVYSPTGEGIGVSRRLEDAERARLRAEAKSLDLGGGGAIIRTAAHGATRGDFERELSYLFKLNEVLQKRVEEATAPALVFQEADLSVRVVRDIFSAHFERAIVDDPKQHRRLISFFSRTAPELVDRVELWEEPTNLFEAYGVDSVIEGMISRRVDLPSGGYLIIDYAEALTVIDINTGSYTGKGKAARLEDTITRTNLEAAEEVVNQLRLRDIGGIIVIDFIDMARARNRDAVLKVLRKALDEDRTKTFVVEISPLGLVEMTRQNVTDGAREIMTKPCPTCHGEGVVKSEETIAIEAERRLRELVAEAGRRRARGLPRAHEPEGHGLLHRRRRPHAARARGGDQPLLPLHRLRGAAARPLRDRRGGRAGRDRGAERAVPRGRGGARRHRRAAHVLRGRRGREGRRLPDRGRPTRSPTWARRCSCGSSTPAARPRAPCWPRSPRRPRRRPRSGARRASAPPSAPPRLRRRGRASARKPATPEAQAVEALTERGAAHAGTGPGAADDSDEDAAKPRGRRRSRATAPRRRRAGVPPTPRPRPTKRRRGRRRGRSDGDDAVQSNPRRRGRRGGRRRSRANAEVSSEASE